MSAISESKAILAKPLNSVAVIMDGNGRWAENRGLPRSEGHIAGAAAVPEVLRAFFNANVRYITLYAFSTENWKRPKSEIEGIMNLIYGYLTDKVIPEVEKDSSLGVRFIGDISPLPPRLREGCEYVSSLNPGSKFLCSVALNYGGRAEIVRASNLALLKRLSAIGNSSNSAFLTAGCTAGIADPVTESELSSLTYTGDAPDPDLVIRTGGERRLSNFLLWQSAYSELLFTDVLWPDVRARHVSEFINEYYSRNRRMGGI